MSVFSQHLYFDTSEEKRLSAFHLTSRGLLTFTVGKNIPGERLLSLDEGALFNKCENPMAGASPLAECVRATELLPLMELIETLFDAEDDDDWLLALLSI